MIELSNEEYRTLHTFAVSLSKVNWGCWQRTEQWPNFQNVGYTTSQFAGGGILFRFDEQVKFKDQRGKRWSYNISRAQAPRNTCRLFAPE
jgi:hypothetical protein